MLTQMDVNMLVDAGCMIKVYDIDNTLFRLNGEPIQEMIDDVIRSYTDGHYIILFTSREGSQRLRTIKDVTKHGIKYSSLQMNKPKAHIYIDDLAVNTEDYIKRPSYYDEKFQKYGDKINRWYRGLSFPK